MGRKRSRDPEDPEERNDFKDSSAGSPVTPRTDSIVTVDRPDDRHKNEDVNGRPPKSKIRKVLFLRQDAGTEADISETTASLEVELREHLNQLYQIQPSIEDCLQTAGSVLLDIFSSPDSPSKDAWIKAARGVRLLEDGLSFLHEAKNLLS
ncbi:unnamed protein product [Prunus brigantina]